MLCQLIDLENGLVKYAPHPESLLILLVKRPYDYHEHGTDATLQKAQEEALRIQVLVVTANNCQDKTDSPDCNDHGCNTLDREALGKIHGRVGSDDEAEIEDGCRHGVPVACA